MFVQRGIRAVKLRHITVGIFLRVNTGVILVIQVMLTPTDSSRNEGLLGLKVVCVKLMHYNFTNVPGHIYQWRINIL